MQLPTIQGTCELKNFFVYVACDHRYFSEFGPSFITSVKANTKFDIHVHLFNPTADQISYCQRNGVSVTWEQVPQTLFASATQRWRTPPDQDPERSQYERTLNAITKGQDVSITERMQKTYYACARFIRLAEIYNNSCVLAVDVDAVVRANFPPMGAQHDFYLHHITGRKARYLAGGLWLNASANCKQFLTQYANQLRAYFEQDYVYWGLDQDLLDPIVPLYNHGQLPIEYIDWNMRPSSYIWTAKGTRKDLAVFVNEQQKYSS